jgi:hypothetical protein
MIVLETVGWDISSMVLVPFDVFRDGCIVDLSLLVALLDRTKGCDLFGQPQILESNNNKNKKESL